MVPCALVGVGGGPARGLWNCHTCADYLGPAHLSQATSLAWGFICPALSENWFIGKKSWSLRAPAKSSLSLPIKTMGSPRTSAPSSSTLSERWKRESFHLLHSRTRSLPYPAFPLIDWPPTGRPDSNSDHGHCLAHIRSYNYVPPVVSASGLPPFPYFVACLLGQIEFMYAPARKLHT